MAKRSRDDFRRGGPPQSDGRWGPGSRHNGGRDEWRPALGQDKAQPNGQPPSKRMRLNAPNNPISPRPPVAAHGINDVKPLSGQSIQCAALLTQLVSEIGRDPVAYAELESMLGNNVANAVMNLRNLTEPKKNLIRELLHKVPKMPDGADPLAKFPSRVDQALIADITKTHSSTIPPLPDIKDPVLARRSFVHRTTFGIDHHGATVESYERLEFVGDAYIELMATRLIFSLYPDLAAGRLSSLREKLVCNETLSHISMAYNFQERVKVPETYLEEGTDRVKIWKKLLGDVLEAYVAAIIQSDLENGYTIAEKWLWQLWAPRLPDSEQVREPSREAKQDLQKRVGGVGVKVEYLVESSVPFKGGSWWTIKVLITGWGWTQELVSTFEGRSKAVAEAGAAEAAMLNPIVAQMQAIKVSYDEKVRKERAEAARLAEASEYKERGEKPSETS